MNPMDQISASTSHDIIFNAVSNILFYTASSPK